MLFPLLSFPQEETPEEQKQDKEEKTEKDKPGPWIGARYRWTEFEGSPYLNSVDFVYKPFVSEKFFLNYHLGLGKAWGDAFHVSTTAGLATGVNLMSNFAEDTTSAGKALRILGIVSAFVPEGVGYYHVLSDRLSIAPYINLLAYDYRKNPDRNIESFLVSLEAGMEGHVHLSKKFNLGLHLAVQPPYLYDREKLDLPIGWQAGVTLHYRNRK